MGDRQSIPCAGAETGAVAPNDRRLVAGHTEVRRPFRETGRSTPPEEAVNCWEGGEPGSLDPPESAGQDRRDVVNERVTR
jgi:hypothetical protein